MEESEYIEYLAHMLDEADHVKPIIKILWLDNERCPYSKSDPRNVNANSKTGKYGCYFDKKIDQDDADGTLARNLSFYRGIFDEYTPEFDWVKNFTEFKKAIESGKHYDLISFDHDLKSPDGNGADCAKFLFDYCKEHNVGLPKTYIHSANKSKSPNIQRALAGGFSAEQPRLAGKEIAHGKIDIGAKSGNTYWFTSVTPDNIGFVNSSSANGKTHGADINKYMPVLSGRKAFDKASVLNPMFLSKNFEYSYSYAKKYQDSYPKSTYIAVISTNLDAKPMFDITDPDNFIELFGNKDDAVVYELFKNAEPYFAWNSNITAFDKIQLRPIEYTLARVILAYRYADKFGKTKNNVFKVFQDEPISIENDTKKFFNTLEQKLRVSILDIIFNDRLKSENFSVPVDINEYDKIRDAYDEQVFGLSLKIGGDGKFVKNKNGAYVKTRYGEQHPDDTNANVNKERPVTRDPSIMTNRESDKKKTYNNKILQIELPEKLSPDNVKYINIYLKLCEKIHQFAVNALQLEGGKLFGEYAEYLRSVKTKNKKNIDAPDYTSPYIEPLQYLLHQMIQQQGGGKWHGMYAPEVIGAKERIHAVDDTIVVWNTSGFNLFALYKLSDIEPLGLAQQVFDRYRGKRYTDSDIPDIIGILDSHDNEQKQLTAKIISCTRKKHYEERERLIVEKYSKKFEDEIKQFEYEKNIRLQFIKKADVIEDWQPLYDAIKTWQAKTIGKLSRAIETYNNKNSNSPYVFTGYFCDIRDYSSYVFNKITLIQKTLDDVMDAYHSVFLDNRVQKSILAMSSDVQNILKSKKPPGLKVKSLSEIIARVNQRLRDGFDQDAAEHDDAETCINPKTGKKIFDKAAYYKYRPEDIDQFNDFKQKVLKLRASIHVQSVDSGEWGQFGINKREFERILNDKRMHPLTKYDAIGRLRTNLKQMKSDLRRRLSQEDKDRYIADIARLNADMLNAQKSIKASNKPLFQPFVIHNCQLYDRITGKPYSDKSKKKHKRVRTIYNLTNGTNEDSEASQINYLAHMLDEAFPEYNELNERHHHGL